MGKNYGYEHVRKSQYQGQKVEMEVGLHGALFLNQKHTFEPQKYLKKCR
jgi:hypothetical protein